MSLWILHVKNNPYGVAEQIITLKKNVQSNDKHCASLNFFSDEFKGVSSHFFVIQYIKSDFTASFSKKHVSMF